MTQKELVLAMLQHEPRCATDFMREFIPRYSARIHELRREGHVIERRRCYKHDWHHSPQSMFVYVGLVVEGLRAANEGRT